MNKRRRQRGERLMRPAVPYYLTNLPQDDLLSMGRWLSQRGIPRWPTYARWLNRVLIAEDLRRKDDSDTPREQELPQMPGDWTNQEVADALECAFAMSTAGTEEHPISVHCGEFIDALLLNVVGYASRRLRNLQ